MVNKKSVSKERRKAQRLNLPVKVKVKWPNKKSSVLELLTKDISGTGFKIRVNSSVKKGQAVKVQLSFPSDKRPINSFAEVIWCKKIKNEKGSYDLGIRHVRVSLRDKERFIFLFCELILNYMLFGDK